MRLSLKSLRIDKERLKKAVFLTAVASVFSLLFVDGLYRLFSHYYSLCFMKSNSDYALVMVCENRESPISSFEKEDYVGFYYHGKGQYPKYHLVNGTYVIKQVYAFPGDTVKVTDNHVYINGEIANGVLKTDRWGKPTKHFAWNGKVPKGKIFVMGVHPRSFDSRYWGFVDENWGLYKCWKIF